MSQFFSSCHRTRGLPSLVFKSQEIKLWLLFVHMHQIINQSIHLSWSRWGRCSKKAKYSVMLFGVLTPQCSWGALGYVGIKGNTWRSFIGKNGLPDLKLSELLLDLCTSHGFSITNKKKEEFNSYSYLHHAEWGWGHWALMDHVQVLNHRGSCKKLWSEGYWYLSRS